MYRNWMEVQDYARQRQAELLRVARQARMVRQQVERPEAPPAACPPRIPAVNNDSLSAVD